MTPRQEQGGAGRERDERQMSVDQEREAPVQSGPLDERVRVSPPAVANASRSYRTIVADPPWEYERSTGLGSTRAALDHYGTMSNAAIAALPVRELSDSGSAHLYLWVTNPRLFREDDDGLGPRDIMAVWGFRYVTVLTWHKLGAPGMGWYFRGDTEHVLFGIRGKAPIEPAIRESNHFAASRGEHSAKPDRFYELVERVSPPLDERPTPVPPKPEGTAMSAKDVCPYKTEAEREAAKKRLGNDCCCCIKAKFQPWHGGRCPHGI